MVMVTNLNRMRLSIVLFLLGCDSDCRAPPYYPAALDFLQRFVMHIGYRLCLCSCASCSRAIG